jgi:hypothetical protein
MEKDILEMLKDLRRTQLDMVAKQEEALQFLRDEAEKSKKIREEAILLQKQAVERAKRIGYFAFPLILVCAGMIVYLILRYRIF